MGNPPFPSNPAPPEDEKLDLKTKLAYGAGDMGAGLTSTIESFALLIFLTDVAGLGPGLAGTILLVGRIWDAISDPVIGFLSDRTRSRWGRRHSWMLFGSIPFAVSFFLLWIVPQFQADPEANQIWLFAYYTIIFLIFNTAYTAVNLPYTSLTPELTQDYDERTKLNSFRFTFSIAGSILGLALGFGLGLVFTAPAQQQLRYMLLGAICSGLAVLPLYWCVWGTEEQYRESTTESLAFWEQFKVLFRNRPFLFVMGIYLCSWLAFQMTAGVISYYALNWIGLDQFFQVALLVQSVAMVMLFFWSALSDRIGKKAVYFLGISIWMLAQIGLFFLPRGEVLGLYLLCIPAGAGISTVYLVPWSMLPDVLELDELRTGQRREGVFYAFMVLLQKLGLALGLFIVGLILETAGFVERVAGQPVPEQPEAALLAIRLVAGPLPGLILIGGLVLTYFYPITRDIHQQVLLQLQERQDSR